jgi:hypothetical protein
MATESRDGQLTVWTTGYGEKLLTADGKHPTGGCRVERLNGDGTRTTTTYQGG